MPHVKCFGRELPDVEFEMFTHNNVLIVDSRFCGTFPVEMNPLQAYCEWLSHGRFQMAELLSLRQLRIRCQNEPHNTYMLEKVLA
jgi:hypothetical protein